MTWTVSGIMFEGNYLSSTALTLAPVLFYTDNMRGYVNYHPLEPRFR